MINKNTPHAAVSQPPKLLDNVRDKIRLKHYSIRTEQAYVDWVRRFILFHGKRHPKEMGAAEVEAFLTHLAVRGKVAASTQNQARSALLFLYKEVLGQQLPWLDDVEQAKRPQRLPVVLTHAEVKAVLDRLSGTHRLMANLLYGTGVRLMEGMRLRVKDIDFERREILVRDGKGGKDRVAPLPLALVEPLRNHLARVKSLHEEDLRAGYGAVYLPDALERKYPNATANGAGSTCFPRGNCRSIPVPASLAAITPTRRACSGPSSKRCAMRAWQNRRHPTPCATASPRTCSWPATTFAPCRNCWATRMSAPP